MYIQSRNKQMMLNCVELAQYVKMISDENSLTEQYETLKKRQRAFCQVFAVMLTKQWFFDAKTSMKLFRLDCFLSRTTSLLNCTNFEKIKIKIKSLIYPSS